MKSEQCKRIACPKFGKFSGKAVCRFEQTKKFLKHMDQCPMVLNTQWT